MLTKWDELMCYQLPATMDHVHTDSPKWTERIYVSIYNVPDQDTIFGFGVGPAITDTRKCSTCQPSSPILMSTVLDARSELIRRTCAIMLPSVRRSSDYAFTKMRTIDPRQQ